MSNGSFIVVEIVKEEDEEEEEEEEGDQIGTSDEELEEDVFRKRKAELTSGAGRFLYKMNGSFLSWR